MRSECGRGVQDDSRMGNAVGAWARASSPEPRESCVCRDGSMIVGLGNGQPGGMNSPLGIRLLLGSLQEEPTRHGPAGRRQCHLTSMRPSPPPKFPQHPGQGATADCLISGNNGSPLAFGAIDRPGNPVRPSQGLPTSTVASRPASKCSLTRERNARIALAPARIGIIQHESLVAHAPTRFGGTI
jgi:hypothetical protein